MGGVGLGASRAKWGFLPNAHTDFIFAIVGEELGLIGTFGVVGLFVAFAVLGIRTALRAPDRFGALLAAGVTAWVCGQAFVNMGAVTSLLPVTGVPLPFVSFGGSSLVVTMAATGILLNVARQARRAPSGRGVSGHRTWAVIAGGGTAGHVCPAWPSPTRSWPGATRPRRSTGSAAGAGSRATWCGAAGFEATLLPGRGIQRRLTAENLGAAWGLTQAGAQALSLLRARRPAVVLAMGGYASVVVRPGRRRPAGAAGGRRAERRPGRGQPAGGPLRQGVRRPLPGHAAAPGRRHRQPGAGRDPGRRPQPGRPGRGPGRPRPAGGPHRWWPSSAARWARCG